MTDAGTHEARVKAFFDRPPGRHGYLEKRFGVEIRAVITKRFLGEVAGLTILDVGCGDGTLSLQYAGRGNHLTLLDVSDRMLESAKQKTPRNLRPGVDYINHDFLKYEFDRSFDIVLCVGVLAHLQSPASAIRRLSRLVKPGGRCIVQTTDASSWPARIQASLSAARRAVIGSPYQYSPHRLSYADVRGLCVQNGFTVAGQCRYSLLLPGMGRLPDKLLFRCQLLTLESPWLSRHGSEVITLLVRT